MNERKDGKNYVDDRGAMRRFTDLLKGHKNFTLRESRYYAYKKNELKKYFRNTKKLKRKLKKNPSYLVNQQQLYNAQIRFKLTMEDMDKFKRMGAK